MSANAWAAEALGDAVSVSGFGTLGAVYHTLNGVGFRRDFSQPTSVPADRLSLMPDSMLGVQFGAHFNERLDGAIQLVSRDYIGARYAPQVSMAYLKFKPGTDSSIRLGRLSAEMYLNGDSAEVGYANLLVRPQVIWYPRTFDGVDAETVYPLDGGTLRLKTQFGYEHGKLLTGPDPYDASGSAGGSVLGEYVAGPWTLRASAGRVRLKNENSGNAWQQLDALLTALPNGAAIRDAVSMRGRRLDQVSLAMAYDQGPVQSMASYSRIKSPHWQDRDVFYANAGYRMGRFTPYLAYTWQHTAPDILPTGYPYGYSTQTDQLNLAAEAAMAGVKVNQTDWAAGLRYELGKNMALKAQVDCLRYRDPETLVDPALNSVAYAGRTWKSMTVYSLAFDFVF